MYFQAEREQESEPDSERKKEGERGRERKKERKKDRHKSKETRGSGRATQIQWNCTWAAANKVVVHSCGPCSDMIHLIMFLRHRLLLPNYRTSEQVL